MQNGAHISFGTPNALCIRVQKFKFHSKSRGKIKWQSQRNL